MGWWKTASGSVIILFAVREMFNDLLHPTQSGALSEWIASRLFRVFRRWPWLLPTAGPLSVALMILAWAILLAIGFALIDWAFSPAAYDFQEAAPSNASDRWWWSFYYSLEMMTTLGLGDIRPHPTWLKILSACHTLIGFSLVTTSITWIVLVFPALRRLRTLARKAITLMRAERANGSFRGLPRNACSNGRLTEEVIQSRVDFIHFPLLFYFYAEDSRASLPCSLIPLMHFAEQGMQADRAPKSASPPPL